MEIEPRLAEALQKIETLEQRVAELEKVQSNLLEEQDYLYPRRITYDRLIAEMLVNLGVPDSKAVGWLQNRSNHDEAWLHAEDVVTALRKLRIHE